jgi:hypothetical protein
MAARRWPKRYGSGQIEARSADRECWWNMAQKSREGEALFFRGVAHAAPKGPL